MKILLATRNRDKAREILELFGGLDVEFETLDAFPDSPVTNEDGATLEANATKKAREAGEYAGLTALADDTGLEVDALDGAPGVYAARFAGEGASYADNCAKLIREMQGVPAPQRGARFRTVMALWLSPADAGRVAAHFAREPEARPRGSVHCLLADGALPGFIAEAPRGQAGFGYDPVFVDGETGRTLAEMTPEEKNHSSHRYRAALEMRETIRRTGLAR